MQEMQFQNYSPRTIDCYSELLWKLERDLAVYLDSVSAQQLKDSLLQRIINEKISVSLINQAISAFKTLQVDVLGREWVPVKNQASQAGKRLPVILSLSENNVSFGYKHQIVSNLKTVLI